MKKLDAARIDQVKNGDAGATLELYHYLTPVFRKTVACEFTLPDGEYPHEDVIAELHHHVRDQLAKYDTDRSLETWARAVAKHYVRDKIEYLTAKKRRPCGGVASLDAPADSSSDGPGTNLLSYLVDQLPSPAKVMSRKERLEEARTAIAAGLMALDSDARTAIEMRYFGEAKIKEIAQEIGKTEKATEGIIRRSRQKLLAYLGRASRYFSSGG